MFLIHNIQNKDYTSNSYKEVRKFMGIKIRKVNKKIKTIVEVCYNRT